MMDWTTRHGRFFLRQFSPRILLYTEMIAIGALIHGDRGRFLAHHRDERPLAVQLGGSDPRDLGHCAAWCDAAGFREINLNVGCPSEKVRSGRFGACLMAEPRRVADCVRAMAANTDLPVTVKSRIGIDHCDDYDFLKAFVDTVAAAGCRTFIVHARKAWLHGLSPRQNREIPPLRYAYVHRLKREFPELEIVVNGGIRDLDSALDHLQRVDGVMIGREAFQNPAMLLRADELVFGGPRALTRGDVLRAYRRYATRRLAEGVPLRRLVLPLLGLFRGLPGARAFRRHLAEHGHRPGASIEVLDEALRNVDEPPALAPVAP